MVNADLKIVSAKSKTAIVSHINKN